MTAAMVFADTKEPSYELALMRRDLREKIASYNALLAKDV